MENDELYAIAAGLPEPPDYRDAIIPVATWCS
jgi:hypothetical protein